MKLSFIPDSMLNKNIMTTIPIPIDKAPRSESSQGEMANPMPIKASEVNNPASITLVTAQGELSIPIDLPISKTIPVETAAIKITCESCASHLAQ